MEITYVGRWEGVKMVNIHWLKGSEIMAGVYGTIQVDRRYQTNVPGIYAIGTVIVPSLDRVDPAAMGLAPHLAGG